MVTTRSNQQFAGTVQPPPQAGCSLNSWAPMAAKAVQPAPVTRWLGSASLRSVGKTILFALLGLVMLMTMGIVLVFELLDALAQRIMPVLGAPALRAPEGAAGTGGQLAPLAAGGAPHSEWRRSR